jgi:hypothetical protein
MHTIPHEQKAFVYSDLITSSFFLSFWISSLTGRYAAVVHRFYYRAM